MKGTLVLFTMMVAATFAARANDYLRGSKSPQNGLFIRLFIVGCFIAPLTMGQWKTSLAMVAAWLIAVRPLAGAIGPRIAVQLWRMGETGPFDKWVGRPPSRLRLLYKAMDQMSSNPDGGDIQQFMKNSDRRLQLKNAALDYSLGQPEIQAILRHYGADRAQLDELFSELIAAGIGGMRMGHYLPYSIAQYPKPLAFLLEWQKDKSRLSHMDVAMLLISHFEYGRSLPRLS